MATRITLKASATENASANGAWIPVPTLSMLTVLLSITGTTGTISDFTSWLEGSVDGTELKKFEIVADHVIKSSGVAAGNAPQVNDRDICDGETGIGDHQATYKHIPAGFVRLRWDLSGTTPTVTFFSEGVGK